MTRVLARVFESREKPAIIPSDNGREFIAETVKVWLAEREVTAAFIAKASPQQNCYAERFNGSMRDELLIGELFHSLLGARVVIGDWVAAYNSSRPHLALGMMTPAAFAASV